MKIIGIAGLAKAGKTTMANAMAATLLDAGFTPVMERFAGPLKDASDMVGMRKGGDTDHLYRSFCQQVGTLAREAADDWWVQLLADRVLEVANKESEEIGGEVWHERVLIIDDLRYPNEVEFVRQVGGTCVFVSAADRLTDLDAEWRQHSSEHLAHGYERGQFEDTLFDWTIPNNDPMGEAMAKAVAAKLALEIVNNAREETR